ncbi:MAG: hypothetical protein EBR68_05935 [Synechococcaceae bacterium WB4_2_0811]|jgi:hypothetical protein|nr:hypothetical protein [Synechococcaceae bacterium WB4_2_0811]NBV69913.1 hypothetical protein [Synechococcaceae bacterium WB4_2_0805]
MWRAGVHNRRCKVANAGFALPLVLMLGLLLLGSGLSLQAMALQSRARGARLWQEGQLNDCFLTAAMLFAALARQGATPADQKLAAGIFHLQQWQGSPNGPAQISLQRLAATGKPMRSKVFQLNSSGELRPVSP